jgi:hypothetical protein
MALQKPDKPIEWNVAKNKLLRESRGLSFEAIIIAMDKGYLIDSYLHPKIAHQRIFEVEWGGYIIAVPYVEEEEKIFLKTAFHSRKINKKYQRGES